jgi:hypothetical protein
MSKPSVLKGKTEGLLRSYEASIEIPSIGRVRLHMRKDRIEKHTPMVVVALRMEYPSDRLLDFDPPDGRVIQLDVERVRTRDLDSRGLAVEVALWRDAYKTAER